MKLIFFFLCLSVSSFAEVFEVHSVSPHGLRENTWIVKLMDGRVGFWQKPDELKLDPQSIINSAIDAHLADDGTLSEIKVLGKVKKKAFPISKSFQIEPQYAPTIYPSYQFATDVLRSMRRNWTRNSECYDRAHVWVYDEFYWYQRYLQKAFLFFSDAYIARYNFRWWFHTAPFALVRMNNQVVERVMDPGFVQYPYQFKSWTDLFMKNKAQCKVVQKYSDYSHHPGEDDCYIIKSSIYYWQPRDLENAENTGAGKTQFIEWEIRHAYEKGFNIRI